MSEEQQQEVVEIKTVTRDLVINSHASEVDIALLEDNVLVELHREKTNNQFAVGDVFLGRVKKILPGLNAAFVDVGYPKEAFLHYLDLGLQANSLIRYKKQIVAGEDVPMDKFKLDGDLPKNGKIGDAPLEHEVVSELVHELMHVVHLLHHEVVLAALLLVEGNREQDFLRVEDVVVVEQWGVQGILYGFLHTVLALAVAS